MSRVTTCALAALSAVLLVAAAGALFAQAAPAPPKIDVHGYMQNRFYMGEGASGEFRSERISISTLATFADTSNAYVELYYHPWVNTNGLYLESAYYDKPIEVGKLRIGKGRRQAFGITPAYPNRKTSNYGIVSEAFTQDRVQGVQYIGSKNNMEAALAVHTAYRLGTRAIGEIPGDTPRNALGVPQHQVPHLALRDPHSGSGNQAFSAVSGQLSQKLQFSGRIGGTWSGVKAGLSYSYAKLDSRDMANLRDPAADAVLRPSNPITGAASAPLLPGATDNTMSQLGFDFMRKWPCGFVLQGEYYDAKVSSLDYDAWNVVLGQEFKNGWKLFARYAQQNMDTPLANNPLTWDVQQVSLSMVQPIAKSVWLQYEYEINNEDALGGGKVDNDLFFIELFSGF
ncbi:MAG: hypothetical protein KBC96_06945 [Armatimonadetes bacterium]|nr:hypothetical protein [Armatimonadota bacterium]